jgi:hypothetical protein
MESLIIPLLILGCILTYKAFRAEDPDKKRIYGLLALFIGGVLFYLSNYSTTP